jgi:YD repeat-containing protein
MKKKPVAILLACCLLLVSSVPICFADSENLIYTKTVFGKYIYYNYDNTELTQFTVVDDNYYLSYQDAEANSSSYATISYTESTAETIRYEKRNSIWVAAEKTEYISGSNSDQEIHYLYRDNSLFPDYTAVENFDDIGNIVSYIRTTYNDNTTSVYSVYFDYDTSGYLQQKRHYLNDRLDHVDSYQYDNYNRLVSVVQDDEKTQFTYNTWGLLKSAITENTNELIQKLNLPSFSDKKITTTSSSSSYVEAYKYNVSTGLPFGHLDLSIDNLTVSYGTNTTGIGNIVRKLFNKENGYIFESPTSAWTSKKYFNRNEKTEIYMTEDEITGLATSIALIILLTTENDGSSTTDVNHHKVTQGKYQYYDYNTANCVTFTLELIRGIIPDRVDSAGTALWGSNYNFSGIYTVSKGYSLLKEVA